MKLTEAEDKYIRKVRHNLALHRKTWWGLVAVCLLLAACVTLQWILLISFVNDMNRYPSEGRWRTAATGVFSLYPLLLMCAAGLGVLTAHIVTRWRPDPAKSLLIKIVEDLDSNKDNSPTDDTDAREPSGVRP